MRPFQRAGLRVATLIAVSMAVVLFCYSFAWAAQAPQSGVRTWRDASGRFSLEAKLLQTSATHVHLRTADGREIAVPIDGLSKDDREYLARRAASSATEFAKGDVLADVRDGRAIGQLPKHITNSIGMKLVLVSAGEFMMGSPESELGHEKWEGPQHRVRITKPFYMGIYEVTRLEYARIVNKDPIAVVIDRRGVERPRHRDDIERFGGAAPNRQPVGYVSWEDAVRFCDQMSDKPEEKRAGRVYRLPTEAEWEYACRAGTTTPFNVGSKPTSAQINFNGMYQYGDAITSQRRGVPLEVGSLPPNAFGLYDMHGNVAEWCADNMGQYDDRPQDDPKFVGKSFHQRLERVYRGGRWAAKPEECRSAARKGKSQVGHLMSTGFRVVCEVGTIESGPIHEAAKAGDVSEVQISGSKGPSKDSESAAPTTQAMAARPEGGGRVGRGIGQFPKHVTNSIGMKLVLVPAGEFMMGSPESELGHEKWEGPQHRVRITKPFYMGIYEVTRLEYASITGKNPIAVVIDRRGVERPRHNDDIKKFGGAAPNRQPVAYVSWEDAVRFCDRMSDKPEEKRAGRVYRLPTEAEWEYACRAGATTPFNVGSKPTSAQINFNGIYRYGDGLTSQWRNVPLEVGSLSPNAFGLYDMHGNVAEWCADNMGQYDDRPQDDPKFVGTSFHQRLERVYRGGWWAAKPADCRSAARKCLSQVGHLMSTGFRVVCEVGTIESGSIHEAAKAGDISAVTRLLDSAPELVNARGEDGWSPLYLASGRGHRDVAELLIARGASVNAGNNVAQATPLHAAAMLGHVDVAKLLCAKGADVNARGMNGLTPLVSAAMQGQCEIVELLLAERAHIDAKTDAGATALYLAAMHGKSQVARLLIENGANVNASDNRGQTPLHIAAFRGDKTMIELLLEKGADTTLKSQLGTTPIEVATRAGHTAIADLMRGRARGK